MFNSLYERERDTKGPSINFIYYTSIYLFIRIRRERERESETTTTLLLSEEEEEEEELSFVSVLLFARARERAFLTSLSTRLGKDSLLLFRARVCCERT
jgi:hypothetical protein